jgi:hypothetical protein
MAWVFAHSGEDYQGEVHVLFNKTYSGATHTTESRLLIEVPDAKPATPSKPPRRTKRVSKRTKPE